MLNKGRFFDPYFLEKCERRKIYYIYNGINKISGQGNI